MLNDNPDGKPLIGMKGVWWKDRDSDPGPNTFGQYVVKGFVYDLMNYQVGWYLHLRLTNDPLTNVCVRLTSYNSERRMFSFVSVQTPYITALGVPIDANPVGML